MPNFQIAALTPPGLIDPAIAIAASRAGALGVLDLEYARSEQKALAAIARLAHFAQVPVGLKLSGRSPGLFDLILAQLPDPVRVVILTPLDRDHLHAGVGALRQRGITILLEAISLDEAHLGEQLHVDGLIAKGYESGGRVGEETTFILLQRLLTNVSLPVWAQGGIGLHSAAACYAAGAAGVVLGNQLLLTHEAALPAAARTVVERLDGSETISLGAELGSAFCLYTRPNLPALAELQKISADLKQLPPSDRPAASVWQAELHRRIGWESLEHQVWPIGQDVALAAPLAATYRSVGGVIDALRVSIAAHIDLALTIKPLKAGSPLAQSHATEYPIVQGPMTRVSDRPAFAGQVAEAGALPFLALALMRQAEVVRLLEDTRQALGKRPWGVGILGFVPAAIRQEQLEAIRAFKPAYALIAGGRPDQALSLEQAGIPTYLHVPSPGLLTQFVELGARRFVFEGRECGGHVGPRTSFVLWNTMIDTLLECVPPDQLERCHVLFAGGIHDALSASMVAVMAVALAQRGVKFAVLLGTAYLFTQEAVTAGAILEGFQQVALDCQSTALLESGPGHATRCAATPYAEVFQQEKRRLVSAGLSGDALRAALEELNLGRLRIASKGIARQPQTGVEASAPKYVAVAAEDQQRQGMYMLGQLAALRHSIGTIAQLHHTIAIDSMERLDRLALPAAENQQPPRPPCNIAIIGMACILPKAPNLQTYWDNILNKVDAITEVPPERWDWRRYYDPDKKSPDKVYSKWGGFLDEVPFDPTQFGIPPSAIPSIEPLQLLMLASVRAALDDAGYAARPFNRKRTAVILGVGGGIADLGQQYAVRSALPALLDDVPAGVFEQLPIWTEDTFPGILLNVTAGRVANRFDLGGVNYTVDAACASSLAAVYLAARELEAGASDMVIVGGGDTVQNPFAFLSFSKTQALSPRGRCSPFDQSADGIAISEGFAILVLKRLADAERDGDRIYAVIKGVGGSSDGRDKSLTAPRPEGQALALERAYAQAGFSPATVGLIEAHGTGTVAGDQAESATLSQIFKAAGAPAGNCALGSVKSMIGHTKSTAGAAGLVKIALALHQHVLPPTLHVDRPIPGTHSADGPLYVNTTARPWLQQSDHPRRAGVSAFGFGGTNFHAVLEEYTGNFLGERAVLDEWAAELLLWSGQTRAEILAALQRAEQALERGARPRLRDLAFSTWQAARDPAPLRLAIVATSLAELKQKLASAIAVLSQAQTEFGQHAPGIYFATEPLARAGQLAFLFPGQASQYVYMLSDLALRFGEVRDQFEQADRALRERLPQSLSAYVFPPAGFTPDEQRARQQALTQTNVAQPALGAAALALVNVLKHLGIEPDLTAGHSFGEYVALCAAGVFDPDTLYKLSEARGRCIMDAGADDLGTMAAVVAGQDRVAEILQSVENAWIANVNAPRQTVISGTQGGVAAALERLQQHGLPAQRLTVACAFHSPVVSPARDRLAAILATIDFSAPRVDVYSNADAAPYSRQPAAIRAALAQHLVSPVRFSDEVQAMYAAGARLFVEVGPRRVLTHLVDQILEQQPHAAIALDGGDQGGLLQLLGAVGELAAHGVPVNLDWLYAGRAVQRLNLDNLASDLGQPASPATTWLVGGGRARPLNGAANTPRRVSGSEPLSQKRDPLSEQSLVSTPATRHPAQAVPMPGVPSAAQAPEAKDEAGRVMQAYQKLMNRFLDTQQQIMLAYLQGSGHDPALAAGLSVDLPAIAASGLEPPIQPADPAPNGRSSEAERAFDSQSLAQQLVALVSERTGYPREMLGLDLNIESDLGIDSIKRIEILGAFQRTRTPADQTRLQSELDRLVALKTLGQMVEAITGLLRGDAAEQSTDPGPDAAPLPRFVLKAVDAPASEARLDLNAGDVFLLTDDGRQVADVLAQALRARGAQVAILRGAHSNGHSEADDYVADLTDAHAVESLVLTLRERYAAPISGLIHLQPLAATASADEQAGVEHEAKILFNLARALSRDFKQARTCRFIATTMMGGSFASAGDWPTAFVRQSPIAGFVKALAHEWPHAQCKVIDLNPGEAAAVLAERVLGELALRDGKVEIGYQGARRVALQAEPARLMDDDDLPAVFDANSIVLITGGARGITAEIARELANLYSPTLLLVGRSPQPDPAEPSTTRGLSDPAALRAALLEQLRETDPRVTPAQIELRCQGLLREREIRRTLEELNHSRAKVRYYSVDVRDDRAFEELIDGIYTAFGRLDGVIHGAGVIEDRLIEDKTPASFARVFDTKVRSAFTLARKLRFETLKYLVFFASVSGRFGNRGQSDYAAANEVLNKLALHLDRQWPARVVSINWGPWTQAGMATPAVQQQLIERGLRLIHPSAGRKAFERELRLGSKGEVEVILGDGFWASANQRDPALHSTGGR